MTTTNKTEAVDMSERAIERRLEQLRALYKLAVSLRTIRLDEAKPVPSR
jgi:hypothetical protein